MPLRPLMLQSHHGGPPLLIQCDDEQRVILLDCRSLHLSKTEYCLLRTLFRSFEVACSYAELVTVLGDSRVTAHSIKALRRLVERMQGNLAGFPFAIRAVVGFGYVLVPADGEARMHREVAAQRLAAGKLARFPCL